MATSEVVKVPEVPDNRSPFGRATIQGRIRFEGTPPPPDPILFDNLGGDCEPLMKNPESIEVDIDAKGGLRHAFVYIYSGLPKKAVYPIPKETVVVNNKDCQFEPKIAGIQVGQTLEMKNSDAVVHNLHGHLKGKEFNYSMAKPDVVITRVFKRPEVMALLVCDIHPWMHSFLGILKHPFFATTSASGEFSLLRVPPGEYVIMTWHRLLGVRELKIKVPDAEKTVTLEAVYTEADLPAPGMRRRMEKRHGKLGWN